MSNNGSSNSGNGIGFGSLLFLTFLILKLTHVIDWSWWWITAPLWGSLVALLVIFGVAFPGHLGAQVQPEVEGRTMRHRIAHAFRSVADRLDPPPPRINVPAPPQFVMPVISPEVAAEMGRRMREMTKAMPKLNFPVLPSPPPAPPAPRRLK